MIIRTQGGWCLLNFNRKLKIFLDTDTNSKIIKELIQTVGLKLSKNQPITGKEVAKLPYVNHPNKNVILSFKKDGRLVFETVDDEGNTLRKIEKLETVKDTFTSLCGFCPLERNLDFIITKFSECK